MWSKRSYQSRVVIAGVGLLVVLLLGYQWSISRTLALYRANSQLELLTATGEEQLIRQISELAQQKAAIDSVREAWADGASETALIGKLVSHTEALSLQMVQMRKTETGLECTVAGAYVHMVRWLRAIETDMSYMKIESLEFVRLTDRRTGRQELRVKTLLRKKDEVR